MIPEYVTRDEFKGRLWKEGVAYKSIIIGSISILITIMVVCGIENE
jgi:hypothetical protein